MKKIRIGTRESQLAVWQATWVQECLLKNGVESELVYIKSDGDIDLVTPLYEIGVQGIFTKTLDAALLSHRIDIAVHSMKDVPVQMAKGIAQAAVLPRASYKDILVFREGYTDEPGRAPQTIATSSIRRKAQWLHRYPNDRIENLRGNVNTRLQKVKESHWQGAIFAAAGVERIGLRPVNSIDLNWMLPAPAQGAVVVVCCEEHDATKESVLFLNDPSAQLCAKLERDFLKALLGGCSAPISALAEVDNGIVTLQGNILTPNGQQKIAVVKTASLSDSHDLGTLAANELIERGAGEIIKQFSNAGK